MKDGLPSWEVVICIRRKLIMTFNFDIALTFGKSLVSIMTTNVSLKKIDKSRNI